jgi:GTP-binding protein HflX
MYLPPHLKDALHLKDAPHLSAHTPPQEVLVSDTIGFIQDLPPNLIKSFQSTLEETIEADLLLHIIDITDPKMLTKINVVNEILGQINAFHKPCIYVFNKTDLLPPKAVKLLAKKLKTAYKKFLPCFVSTINKEGIEELKDKIGQNLFKQRCPHSNQISDRTHPAPQPRMHWR